MKCYLAMVFTAISVLAALGIIGTLAM